MSKTKELIICILTIMVLALVLTTNIFTSNATEETDINVLLRDANNTNTNNNFQSITEGNTNNTTINSLNNTSNTINNTNTLNNTNKTINSLNNVSNNNIANNTKIPDTGLDYSVVFIIAVCAVSAFYAYKKIRDYNNI